MQVALGSKARDKITGYTGIVIATTDWLSGCRRVTIQTQEMKDGKPIDSCCFDESQVETIEEKTTVSEIADPARPGGPAPSPKRTGH
jgi:hypothetical protein